MLDNYYKVDQVDEIVRAVIDMGRKMYLGRYRNNGESQNLKNQVKRHVLDILKFIPWNAKRALALHFRQDFYAIGSIMAINIFFDGDGIEWAVDDLRLREALSFAVNKYYDLYQEIPELYIDFTGEVNIK